MINNAEFVRDRKKPVADRRTHKRYNVDLLDVTGTVIKASNIEIVNVSLNGICLKASRRLNVGEHYSLKIQSKERILNLQATVIWSKISRIQAGFNGDTIPVYTAGLEFLSVSKYMSDEIIQFIKNHEIREARDDDTTDTELKQELRRCPRFRVNTPLGAFIIDQSEYIPVKDLSFGGFCIKSRIPIKINTIMPMIINISEDKFISFLGKIASCRLIKKAYPKSYTIGVSFDEMAMEERKKLTEYIVLLSDIDKSPSR